MPKGAVRTQLYAKWLRDAITKTYGTLAHGYQEKLAAASAVSRDTIWRILRGRTVPSRETVGRLATALGVDPPSELVAPATARSPSEVRGRLNEPRSVYIAGAVASLSPEDMKVIGKLAADAVRATVEKNELHTGRDGYRLVSEALTAFADRLLEEGVDRAYLADIYDVIGKIGHMKQRRLDPPNDQSSPQPGSGT